jgi:Flp pilus assembly protein TadD
MADISRTTQLAVQHHQNGRLSQAEHLYRLVLQSRPDHPFVLHALALIAYQTSRHDLALDLVAKAIEANPQMPQFHNTRGVVLEALGRPEQALESYRQALSLEPEYAEAHHNTAIAMLARQQYAAAAQKCKQAASLAPDSAQVYNTMGFCLQKQGRPDEAIENYKQAVRLAPDFAEAHNHLGVVLSAVDRHEQAIENYSRAVQIDPQYAEAHWNLSLALLLTGRLAEGWKEYEWRRSPELQMMTYPHHYDLPRWDGSPFVGRRLLVHYEQGFGDTIQFIRYLPMVKARGGAVILEVRKPLVGLLHGFPGIDELVEASPDVKPAADFDMHVSLMDLPGIFGTTLDNVPADVPYLHADSAKARHWRTVLSGDHFKVGIVWSGSPAYERNHVRSCSLEHFAPLAAVPGVKLYSLQKGAPAAQLKEFAGKIPVTDLADHLHDFSDTAAVIEDLDLIISVDTCVPHLAGAMGKHVWLLLCSAPAWQWMLDRPDSPWYLTMRIFRQTQPDHWHDVFQQVTQELTALLHQPTLTHPIPQS